METEKTNRRICQFCKLEFSLTKKQLRQTRKAIFCTRTCARRHQHTKNHADKRQEKACETCGKEFIVSNWNRAKQFCSVQCSSISRYGAPRRHLNEQTDKVKRMVSDPQYYKWLQRQARKAAIKYNVDDRDLLQDFFLSALEGKTAKFEHVFYNSIRSEYQRGITGKTDAADFTYDETLLAHIRDNRRSMSEYEFIEYLCDLRSICSETEFKLVCLYIIGFDQGEIWEQSKDISRRELAALWKRLGLRRGIA